MNATLPLENAIKLDRFIRTTKAEYILFDTTSALSIQLITSDSSHFTTISFEDSFFSSYASLNRVVSIPVITFYKKNMKDLAIVQSKEYTELVYRFSDAVVYKKTIQNLRHDPFEIEFTPMETICLDFICLKGILRYIKSKSVSITFGRKTTVREPGRVSVINDLAIQSSTLAKPTNRPDTALRLNTSVLKDILGILDLFDDYCIAISNSDQPIHIIFRSEHVFVSSFMSTE